MAEFFVLIALTLSAPMYKCDNGAGGVTFSDIPCGDNAEPVTVHDSAGLDHQWTVPELSAEDFENALRRLSRQKKETDQLFSQRIDFLTQEARSICEAGGPRTAVDYDSIVSVQVNTGGRSACYLGYRQIIREEELRREEALRVLDAVGLEIRRRFAESQAQWHNGD